MTQLERRIRSAQHVLWVNQWLHALTWLTGVVAAGFAALALVQRLYDLPIPLAWIALGLTALAMGGSIAWLAAKRADAAVAAAKLDEAAGLKERLSSGRYCLTAQDAFAQAVVADADRISRSLSPRRHVRLTAPRALPWSALCLVAAAATFLVSPGALRRSEAERPGGPTEETEQARAIVKRRLEEVRKVTDQIPALADLKEEVGGLDFQATARLETPSDVRHDAVKKIDRLADAVKQKRQEDGYHSTAAMRKMLRGLKIPGPSDAPTQQLARALQLGDFKAAKEEMQALREQLATLKQDEDKELVARISRQLDDLAKQLEKLANDEELVQRLEQAGLKKEHLDRLLQNLKKEDIEQIRKLLEEKGLSQGEIQKIVQQMQRRQSAGGITQSLAKAMQQGARAATAGETGSAMAGLSMAADQLGDLELLEQEMNQLDSVLADLQSARDNLSRPCPSCTGAG